ncbi:MAG: hypothetical protein NC453_23350 [Muribaculum sp.]|nr:hypothetical protein [Muribaculum sp.]
MIYIQRVRSNDIGDDYGKQVELGKTFMSYHKWDAGEIPVTITFCSLSEEQNHLNGTKIKTSFKVRGDERGGDRIGIDCKEYSNEDRICALKQFLTDKLNLSPAEDYFILEDVGNDGRSFKLYGVHSHDLPASLLLDRFKGQVVDMEEPQKAEIPRVFNYPLQQIFYGAPGTGKSFTIDDTVNDENSVRTTFHPDSDYVSFVGAYKPTMEDVPITTFDGSRPLYAVGHANHPGTEKKIVYKYVPQAFLKAYVAAWSNLDKPYFLIIEEINRGNCAQIFGDLFQLLDRNNAGSSSYAIHSDEDISQFLSSDKKGFASLSNDQKDAIRSFTLEKDNGKTQPVGQDILDGKLLLLPPNLYIWATMNTSDQSLFPIDSAFKRRWNWKYMPIEYTPTDKKTGQTIEWKVEIAGNLYSWGAFIAKINPEIYTLTESSDKQMGYFFAKANPKTGIISEDVFLNKVLFYLWTDVFKDYDVSSEYFQNKNKNRSFRFTDFFDKEQPTALSDFIDNFKLDVVIDEEHVGEVQNEKGEWVQPTFRVDGETGPSMIDTVLLCMKKYFDKYPDISTDEAVNVWNSFGLPKHALETEQVFDERTDMTKNRASKVFTAPDGRKFYVSAQLRKQHMDKLIAKAKEWGIDITRLS